MGYPYNPDLLLRRRKQTRKGDLSRKLARDIHILTMVLDGSEFEELKEILSYNSSTLYTPDSIDTTEIDILKKTVDNLLGDITVMKQASAALANEVLKEVTNLKTEISKNKAELQGEVSELRELIQANAVSIDRLCSDKSNGNACLRNEIKLINSDMKGMADILSAKVEKNVFVAEAEKLVTLTKRVGKLEKPKVQSGDGAASISQNEKAGQRVSADIQVPERSVVTIQDNHGTYAQVVNNFRKKGQNIDASGAPNPEATVNSFVSRLNNIFLAPHDNPTDVDNSALYRDGRQTRNTNSRVGTTRNRSTRESRQSVHDANQDMSAIQHQTSATIPRTTATVGNRRSVPDPPEFSRQPAAVFPRSTPTGVDYRQSTVHTAQHIATRVNNQTIESSKTVNVDQYPSIDDEEDFSVHVKRRVKRFYVGGFKSSMTIDKLIRYVERRGVTVTWVKIFPVRNSTRVTIRLNVEDDDYCEYVLGEQFWPRNVVCRPWVSWGSYRKNGPMRRDQSDFNDPDNY